MAKKSWYTSNKALSFVVFLLVIFMYLVLIPEGYRYDSDVRISPYGMAIVEGYLDHGLGSCQGMPHFVQDGKLQCYRNWPPLGFMTFALWMKIFGDTLFSARILMVLISALSILPVYSLLRQFQPNRKSLVWGLTLLYGLLPYTLLYSSLVYIDVFIPLLWASATLLHAKKKIRGLIALSLLGFFIHWMAIFPLIAFAFVKLFKKNTLISILYFFILIQGSIGLICEMMGSSVGLFNRLYEYSIWPSLESPIFFGTRFATFILHLSPIILVLIFPTLRITPQHFTKRGLHKTLQFAMTTSLLMASVFPQWILLHNHTIPFLSLLGILSLLYHLRSYKIQYVSFAMALGLALMVSLVHSQVTIPKLAKDLNTNQARDIAFQGIITKTYIRKDYQPTIVFVFESQNADNILSEPFAFKERCDACIYTEGSILQDSFLSKTIKSSNRKLDLTCDTENLYVITDRYNESSRKLLNLRFTHTLLHQQDGLFLIQLRSVDKP